MVTRCADLLSDTYDEIQKRMIALGLIRCDETGTRVDGKTWWVHNAFDALFTFLSINQTWDWLGMNDAGIFPEFCGIIVHDCRGSYWKYTDCIHAICCAHLLRELNGIEGNHPEQTWAKEFKTFLLEMKKVKDKAIEREKKLSAIIIFIYLMSSMMKSSKRLMKRIPYLNPQVKSVVVRKSPKY